MRSTKFVSRAAVHHPRNAIREWHFRYSSFVRAFPSWEQIELQRVDELARGHVRLFARIRSHGYWQRWIFCFSHPKEREAMRLKMEEGPFNFFEHIVQVRAQSESSCEVIDQVDYLLPFPRFFRTTREKYLNRRLKAFFLHKREVMENDLRVYDRYPFKKPLRILISGSTGLIGSSLVPFLRTAGHEVVRLVRSPELAGEGAIYFSTNRGEVDRSQLENFDAVIHLAGQSISKGKWSKKNKKKILSSRVESTRYLSRTLTALERPPRMFLCASAVGFYGNRKDKVLDEDSRKGKGFLPDICKAWEKVSDLMRTRGIRVANLRFGMVLSSAGGALEKMLPPFKWGLGGSIGNGNQYISWIAIDDLIAAIYHILMKEELDGPINLVSPDSITNFAFSEALAKKFNKPLKCKVPPALLRLRYGEMADELLLASTRVIPKKLLATDYEFLYPKIDKALDHLIDAR